MIRFSSAVDGTPVMINQDRIFTVTHTAAGTAILSAGGDTTYVKQSLNEVERRISAAQAAAPEPKVSVAKPTSVESTAGDPVAEPAKPKARARAKKS